VLDKIIKKEVLSYSLSSPESKAPVEGGLGPDIADRERRRLFPPFCLPLLFQALSLLSLPYPWLKNDDEG